MQIWAVAPVKHIASKFFSGQIDYERQNLPFPKSKSMGGKDENGKKISSIQKLKYNRQLLKW